MTHNFVFEPSIIRANYDIFELEKKRTTKLKTIYTNMYKLRTIRPRRDFVLVDI